MTILNMGRLVVYDSMTLILPNLMETLHLPAQLEDKIRELL